MKQYFFSQRTQLSAVVALYNKNTQDGAHMCAEELFINLDMRGRGIINDGIFLIFFPNAFTDSCARPTPSPLALPYPRFLARPTQPPGFPTRRP